MKGGYPLNCSIPSAQPRTLCHNRSDSCLKLTNHMHPITMTQGSMGKTPKCVPHHHPPIDICYRSRQPVFSNPEGRMAAMSKKKNILVIFSNDNKIIHFPFSHPFLFHTCVYTKAHTFKLDSFGEYTVERVLVILFFIATLYM